MSRIFVLLMAGLLVFCVPSMVSEVVGEGVAELQDGTVYTYETYGSGHPNYRCTVLSIETNKSCLYVTTVLEGYDVTEISSGALISDTVEVVVIPEKVSVIKEGAFESCVNLRDVYFLGDMPEMDGAFPEGAVFHHVPGASGWSGLSEEVCTSTVIESGSSVDYILIEGEWMAVGGSPSSDGSVTLVPEIEGFPVTSVGPYSFAGVMQDDGEVAVRGDIVRISIPEGISLIRERAFYYCAGLQAVEIPEGLTAIMDEAFRMAKSLSSVSIPGTLEIIGFEAFRDCHSLTVLDIPDSVGSIGGGAFYICSSLEKVSAGSSVTEVSERVFGYCSSLKEVKFSGEVKSIGAHAFYLDVSLEFVNLSEVETIGVEAFRDCAALRSVDFGDSLKSLGQGAFNGCTSIVSVHLPATLKVVGERAFAYCTSLSDVYFEGDMPEFGASVFLGTDAIVHYTREHSDTWSSYDGNSVADGSTSISYWILAAVIFFVVIAGVLFLRRRSSEGGR